MARNSEILFCDSRKILQRFPDWVYVTMHKYPLLMLIIFGWVGIFVDLDHFVSEPLGMGRPLHLFVFIGLWICCIGYGTYLYRYNRSRLKEMRNER